MEKRRHVWTTARAALDGEIMVSNKYEDYTADLPVKWYFQRNHLSRIDLHWSIIYGFFLMLILLDGHSVISFALPLANCCPNWPNPCIPKFVLPITTNTRQSWKMVLFLYWIYRALLFMIRLYLTTGCNSTSRYFLLLSHKSTFNLATMIKVIW